jgi:ABC-type transport system involved in multi-copper enzyme maturation permease subunit
VIVGLLRAELLKGARQPLVWWLFAALVATTLLRGLAFPPGPGTPRVGLWSPGLVTAAVIILAAVTIGQEFSEGTFRALVSRGLRRGQLLAAQWLALVFAGGALLVLVEGLAVLINLRSQLRWGELARAWLTLWPYVSLVALLGVLARSGGLPLVVGVLVYALESFAGMVVGFTITLGELPGVWRLLSPDSPLVRLYGLSLSYNGANWTYAAVPQQASAPAGLVLLAMPRSATYSAVMLGAYAVLGLALAMLIVYRGELVEAVPGRKRRPSHTERWGIGKPHGRRLPAWSGRGPIVIRRAYAHLSGMAHTSLVKIGAGTVLLFPLTLWVMAKAMDDTAFLSRSTGGGDAPLAVVACLLLVGPLAAVISAFAIGNELTLGTRRAELARGITRLQAIVAESLALTLVIGLLLAWLMALVLLLGAALAGIYPLASAALTILAGTLAAGTYVGVVQVGAALTGSSLGAVLAGLGFLLADWLALIAPTLTKEPGLLRILTRYSVVANAGALAGGGRMIDTAAMPQPLSRPAALLLLIGGILICHALAILIARQRDA